MKVENIHYKVGKYIVSIYKDFLVVYTKDREYFFGTAEVRVKVRQCG